MRIHQVTDLHVPDSDDDARFSHVRENVRRQFRFVESEKPDLLVISGDLTMTDDSEPACRWLLSNLPNVPVIVIPGNHDDPAMIKELFGPWPTHKDFDNCTLVFADSSSDHLPPNQLSHLATIKPEMHCLLFVHHPPCLIGSGFMSKNQPLLNHEVVAQAISESEVSHVFCGHFHNEAQLACNGFEVFLTPSPAYQIALDVEEFTMEEFQPAVRKIDVDSAGVKTELVYV